jgi:snRNA-activating protein complex subunit 3
MYRVVTINDKLAPENPCFFCENCYGPLHYDDQGNVLYDDFYVFPYYPE